MPVDKDRIKALAEAIQSLGVDYDLNEYRRGGKRRVTSLGGGEGSTGGGVSGGRTFPFPDLEPDVFKMRQRYAESGFRDDLTSPRGAMGRYQIMPITLKEYTQRTGKTGDLMDPEFNEAVRDWYMDVSLPRYEAIKRGDPTDIVREYRKYAAYNWGPGNLNKALNRAVADGVNIDKTIDWINYLPKETRDYLNFIVSGNDVPDTSKTAALYEKAGNKYGIFGGGGGIHIKPSHKGRLTELKRRTGKTEAELYNDGNPAHKRMVVFARNARKWKHSDGGSLYDELGFGDLDILRAAVNNVRNSEINRYDGETEDSQKIDRKRDSDAAINMGEIQPASVKAYEPLFVDKPYTADDFFSRWYSNRRNQVVNNLAEFSKDHSVWPFGHERRAEKNADKYVRSLLGNMDNLHEYALDEYYIPDYGGLPDALTDPEARSVLTNIKSSNGWFTVPEGGYSDEELLGIIGKSYGFSNPSYPNYIFYDRQRPTENIVTHERTHTLSPKPGELKKYHRYFGNSPMELKAKNIADDMIESNPWINKYDSSRYFTQKMRDGLDGKDEYNPPSFYKYLADPSEIVARLNAMRKNAGINPNHTVTKEDLKLIREKADRIDREGLLDLYTDEALLRFFNEIALNETGIVNKDQSFV